MATGKIFLKGGFDRTILLVCFALLLAKVAAVAVYYLSYDYVTTWLSDISLLESYANHTLFLRESSSKEVLAGLGGRFDSNYYLRIAKEGYSNVEDFAFAPGYPFFVRVLSFTGVGYTLSGVLISNLFTFISVVLFYEIAIGYIDKKYAGLAAFLFAFFPYNFISGTLAYSEPVFIAFSMLSWIMLERKSYGWCGLMVFIASLMRFQGVLLYLIYSVLVLWRLRKNPIAGTARSLTELNMSALFFVYWFFWLIPERGLDYSGIQENYWGVGFGPLQSLVYMSMREKSFSYTLMMIVFVSIAGLLSYRIKPEFGVYSLIFLVFYLSVNGIAVFSISRFLGTIWPAFLYAGSRIGRIGYKYGIPMYFAAAFTIAGMYLLILQMNWVFTS